MSTSQDEGSSEEPTEPSRDAVPGPGDPRDAENPRPRPTPEEQRERTQQAELGSEAEEDVVEVDETDERPGTSGVQPGLPPD